jgi:5-methylcytosine-specific restriction endonuclease McrA
MARQWRDSSKRRCAKLGRAIELPSIDQVESYLLTCALLCAYCGIVLGSSKKTKPIMDHKQPISRGGTAETDNLGLCCAACNGAKGPLNESEFRELLSLISTWEDKGKALLIRLRGGFWSFAGGPKEITSKLISAALDGHEVSVETRQKIGHANRGRPGREVSEDERERISLKLTGLKRSDETRTKMSAAQKRRVLSPEAIANITAANRRPLSDETRQKMREAKLGSNNPWFGKDLSHVRAARKQSVTPQTDADSQ